MSAPPPSVKKTLGTCINPKCPNIKALGTTSFKAPLKCKGCKTARYCDTDCQRTHWLQHKEYCAIWSQFSAEEGLSLAQVKMKMASFIWLMRGMREYVAYMFKEYEHHRRKGLVGIMEFHFDSCEKLFNAVQLLQNQPIVQPDFHFIGMPGSPSAGGATVDGNATETKLAIRKLRKQDESKFAQYIDDNMAFTTSETRTNLQKLLNITMRHKHLFIVSVTVVLPDTYSTHMYDYYYRDVNWLPELTPEKIYDPLREE